MQQSTSCCRALAWPGQMNVSSRNNATARSLACARVKDAAWGRSIATGRRGRPQRGEDHSDSEEEEEEEEEEYVPRRANKGTPMSKQRIHLGVDAYQWLQRTRRDQFDISFVPQVSKQ
eukprot:1180110-Prorocentrum_minimum.AAC.3